jgi:hypothetical protein
MIMIVILAVLLVAGLAFLLAQHKAELSRVPIRINKNQRRKISPK